MKQLNSLKKTKTPSLLLKSLPVFILVSFSIAVLCVFFAPLKADSETKPKTSAEESARADAVRAFSDTETASRSEKGEQQRFVGYRHKGVVRGAKLPNGVKDLGGGLLSNEDYGVTRFGLGKKYMLWLEKIVELDADGVPEWEVKDVLVFERPKKNQKFLFSYSSPCARSGAEDLDLIVLAEIEPKRKTYKILKAWRADVEAERFEEISTDSIICRGN